MNDFDGQLKRYGGNNIDMQNINRSIVMQLIYKQPGTTRSTLAKQIGLTEAAISKIVNTLIEAELIQETGFVAGQKGRRAVGLEVNSENHRVLAIKLSRRRIKVGIFCLNGMEMDSEEIVITEEEKANELLDTVIDRINHYRQIEPRIRAIGMAVPGPFDFKKNYITVATEMSNFVDVDLKPILELDLKIPVILIHDANAGVMSEWLHNKDIYIEDDTVVYYLAGEGVGAGAISSGQLLLGDSGTAGEIGHISLNIDGEKCGCGNYGCLEMYCSSIAFVRKAHLLLNRYPNSLLHRYENFNSDDIFECAREGDMLALQVTKEAGRALGYGAINIINAYDPAEIIIGDLMANGEELILDEIKAVVQERVSGRLSHEINIILANPEYDHILHGAASIAINKCLENPFALND